MRAHSTDSAVAVQGRKERGWRRFHPAQRGGSRGVRGCARRGWVGSLHEASPRLETRRPPARSQGGGSSALEPEAITSYVSGRIATHLPAYSRARAMKSSLIS